MTKEWFDRIICDKCKKEIDTCSYCSEHVSISRAPKFNLWTRKQDKIESKLGYRFTDIDCIWSNENIYQIIGKKTVHEMNKFIIIETKKFNKQLNPTQKNTFEYIHNILKFDKKYFGFHLIQFERESPEDGKIYLNLKEINKEIFIKFLQFELDEKYYISYFDIIKIKK